MILMFYRPLTPTLSIRVRAYLCNYTYCGCCAFEYQILSTRNARILYPQPTQVGKLLLISTADEIYIAGIHLVRTKCQVDESR